MDKIIIFGILFSIIFFTHCTKSKVENECITTPQSEECIDIPPPTGGTFWGYQWTKFLPYYDHPNFNPNNPEELIFRLQETLADSLFQLVTYNLSTKEQEVIHVGNFVVPRWSKKDWILFAQSDYNIYKIKSNGDSLTQLTFSGKCHGADWNIIGDKFIYYTIDGNNFSVISDENGNSLDTIQPSGIFPSWQHDSLILNPQHMGFTITNPKVSGYNYINDDESDPSFTLAEWLDNENAIGANNNGIFRADINTGEFTQILESCNAKFYSYPTVSKISNKVVFQRSDKQLIETEVNKGTLTSRMFMMNFDGSEREEIILPQ
jgi:hypothetical protein